MSIMDFNIKPVAELSIEENNDILHKYYQTDIIEYTKAIEIDPTDDVAWFNRGITRLKIYDFSGSIIDLSKSLEIYAQDERAYYFRAVSKYNMDDYAGAISDVFKAFEINPKLKVNDWDNIIHRGINDYINTINDYTNAIEYNPWDTKAYQERAQLKEYAGYYSEANADYTKIIEMDSCNIGAYFKRGYNKYFHLKDHTGALEDFDSALKISPEAQEIYLHRASVKETLNEFEGAIDDYSKIIELFNLVDPEDEEDFEFYYEMAYCGRAHIKQKLNDYKGAIDDYTEAIKFEPLSYFGYSGRGSAKIEIGNYIGAISDCTKALKIYRQDAGDYNNSCLLYTSP